jgi:hypothetical protein
MVRLSLQCWRTPDLAALRGPFALRRPFNPEEPCRICGRSRGESDNARPKDLQERSMPRACPDATRRDDFGRDHPHSWASSAGDDRRYWWLRNASRSRLFRWPDQLRLWLHPALRPPFGVGTGNPGRDMLAVIHDRSSTTMRSQLDCPWSVQTIRLLSACCRSAGNERQSATLAWIAVGRLLIFNN